MLKDPQKNPDNLGSVGPTRERDATNDEPRKQSWPLPIESSGEGVCCIAGPAGAAGVEMGFPPLVYSWAVSWETDGARYLSLTDD